MDDDAIARSLNGIGAHLTAHQTALRKQRAEILAVEKRRAAETAKFHAALAQERIERAALEAKHRVALAEADTSDRAIMGDVADLEKHVHALDSSMAVSIRKSAAPRSTVAVTTPIRDADGRVTETVTIDPARPGVATIRRFIRKDYRIVASEVYEVEAIDETEDET